MLYHYMRGITIKIKDDDYLNFQTVANESGLRMDEKILQIIVLIKILTENKNQRTHCVWYCSSKVMLQYVHSNLFGSSQTEHV